MLSLIQPECCVSHPKEWIDVRIAGVKVMVIDDSNTIRRSAEIFLGQAGCEVILAEDGFDALSKIADRIPILSLLTL